MHGETVKFSVTLPKIMPSPLICPFTRILSDLWFSESYDRRVKSDSLEGSI